MKDIKYWLILGKDERMKKPVGKCECICPFLDYKINKKTFDKIIYLGDNIIEKY